MFTRETLAALREVADGLEALRTRQVAMGPQVGAWARPRDAYPMLALLMDAAAFARGSLGPVAASGLDDEARSELRALLLRLAVLAEGVVVEATDADIEGDDDPDTLKGLLIAAVDALAVVVALHDILAPIVAPVPGPRN